MTFDDIRQNVKDHQYKSENTYALQRKLLKPDAVIDEDQTVRWNREQIELRNNTIRKQIQEVHDSNNKKCQNFKCHMFEAALKDYRFNDNQCEMIFNKLMSELDCNYVCVDFVNEFEDMCDFVYQCWNA